MLLVILTENKSLERFTKNDCKKQTERVEKVIKKKLYVQLKSYDDSFNSWVDKKDIVLMSKYFPKPKSFGVRVKVESDLSNYLTKANLNNASCVDTLKFAKKVDLASSKSKVDKLGIDKLVPVPVDLSKLNDVIKIILSEKMYMNLRSKILKIHITNLANNTTLTAKMNEIKNKIPDINNLAANTVLTAVENKISNHSKYYLLLIIILYYTRGY